MLKSSSVLASCLALLATPYVHAMSIGGCSGGTCFQAEATYNYTGSTYATLTIEMENQSDMWLTALAFNNPEDTVTHAALWAPEDWNILGSEDVSGDGNAWTDDVNIAPDGYADLGASTEGNWEGGGSPSYGVAAGDTQQFIFVLWGNATDLSTLTIADFFGSDGGELSTSQGNGGELVMAVRFRGGDGGASAKVAGYQNPIPPAFGLFAAGMGLVGWYGRRKRTQ